MTLKKANAILSIAMCTCLLSGCTVSISSASSQPQVVHPNSESSSTSEDNTSSAISSTVPTTGVDSTDSSAPDIPQENEPPQDQSDSAPSANDTSIHESDLASYTQDLSRFFHSPIESTEDISLDYYLSFFLLYQTFETHSAGSSYTQNENYFWEIPESDLLQTAEDYLGISDLSLSDITEWPFGAPQNGMCYYSEETSLPYSDATVTEVAFDEAAGKASVCVEVHDSQYEDSSDQVTHLIYHFVCTESATGENIYLLQSIGTK